MPRVMFTANIQRHVACPETTVAGRTVREVLDNVFAQNPAAHRHAFLVAGLPLSHSYVPFR